MKYKRFLPALGIILFIYILSNLNIGEIFSLILNARPEFLLLSALLFLPAVFFRALKWKTIIKSYGIDYPVFKASKAWLVGFFIGIITPGRIGDLSRSYYLKKERGVSLGNSLTTVVVDRIIDVAVLFFLALVGLVLIASMFLGAPEMILYTVALFALFMLGVFMMTRRDFMKSILKPLYNRFAPEKYKASMGSIFNDFYHGVSRLSRSRISAAVLIGIISWIISILQMNALALAMGLDLSFFFFFAVAPIVGLLDALPISFSGIGTRDAALVFFFAMVAVSPEMAVSVSLLAFLINYVLGGIMGLILWIRDPIKLDRF